MAGRRSSRPGPRNALYAQSGGVTAVINATAAGVIEACRRHRNRIGRLYAGRDGIVGALTEDLIDTGRESAATIRALKHTPAGAFGSARYKLKDLERDRAKYERPSRCSARTTSAISSTTAATTRWTPR
jgi:6-phosphofructokinase 1